MNISFSGCGFLGIYHVGVASAIREYAPDLGIGRVSGASAGSIAACCLLCGCCLGQGTSDVLKIVIQARSRALGPLHPNFNMVKILRDGMRKILPANAHELASGRLHISLTRFTDGENVIVSKFDSKEEVVQALICSTFIPFYCGTVPPTFKGVRYIDGGWSDNCPVLDGDTITVSPFSGESDICPADSDSASWMGFSVNNSSFRFTARNLYRFSVALFPPHPEVMSRMCRQGFEDTLKFLAKNDLITCMRCIAVRSCITLPEDSLKHSAAQKHGYVEEGSSVPVRAMEKRKRLPRTSSSLQLAGKGRKRSISTPNLGEVFLRTSESDCESCLETTLSADSKGLPSEVVHTLKDAEALDKTLLGRLLTLGPIKWLRYLTIPCLLPWDIAYSTCVKLLEWLPTLPKDMKWLVDRATAAAQFVATEIDTHRHLYSARFTCQLAVTEMTYGGPTGYPSEESLAHNAQADGGRSRRNSWDSTSIDLAAGEYLIAERNFGFSVDMNARKRPVRKLAGFVRRDSPSRSDIPAEAFANATAELEWEGLQASRSDKKRTGSGTGNSVVFSLDGGGGQDRSEQEFDNLGSIVEYARRHEALMSYYYLDENQQVKVTEIYGIKEAGVSRSGGITRRSSFKGPSRIVEEADSEEEQDSRLPSPVEAGVGITVSIRSESPSLDFESKDTRDACCSPVKEKEFSGNPRQSTDRVGSSYLRRARSRASLRDLPPTSRAQMHQKRISAPLIGMMSSDSEEGGSEELFVPERRRRTLSEDASAYEAENSSTEHDE